MTSLYLGLVCMDRCSDRLTMSERENEGIPWSDSSPNGKSWDLPFLCWLTSSILLLKQRRRLATSDVQLRADRPSRRPARATRFAFTTSFCHLAPRITAPTNMEEINSQPYVLTYEFKNMYIFLVFKRLFFWWNARRTMFTWIKKVSLGSSLESRKKRFCYTNKVIC